MPHKIKPLPFDKDLIGISKKTLEIHHGKLYAGYVNKRNEVEEKIKTADMTQANATYSEFGELKRQETFAADAMVLHERYFKNLSGPLTISGQAAIPEGKISEQIKKDFGTYENWEQEFKAAGLASRGWVV
ncbi:MAG: Fe-Mn family superoxide dismutase, partial [Patescibacteria group bacterium]